MELHKYAGAEKDTQTQFVVPAKKGLAAALMRNLKKGPRNERKKPGKWPGLVYLTKGDTSITPVAPVMAQFDGAQPPSLKRG